jgi:hypothetical protein
MAERPDKRGYSYAHKIHAAARGAECAVRSINWLVTDMGEIVECRNF